MGMFLDALKSASPRSLLWLDLHDYAAKLLSADLVPWLDCAALVTWQRKAQGLLKSDVIALPMAAVCAAWLAKHVELKTAMAAKRRVLFPLKTLLADEVLRVHLLELARALRASFAELPFALVVPSPRIWASLAYAEAFGSSEDIDIADDDADSAAMYLADFLRTFGDCGIDVVLLDESATTQVVSAESLSSYQSVLNVAAHYRWVIGVFLPSQNGIDLGNSGIDFAIAVQANTIPTGVITPENFWANEPAPVISTRSFRYARIPPTAAPEHVLDRLAVLRASA